MKIYCLSLVFIASAFAGCASIEEKSGGADHPADVRATPSQVPSVSNPQSDEGQYQPAVDAVYTCPMHPEVREAQPGRCPECGMDLVPEDSSDAVGAQDAGHAQH
jgi:P-type Cu+ transporter